MREISSNPWDGGDGERGKNVRDAQRIRTYSAAVWRCIIASRTVDDNIRTGVTTWKETAIKSQFIDVVEIRSSKYHSHRRYCDNLRTFEARTRPGVLVFL
jgi:hypothetical protein